MIISPIGIADISTSTIIGTDDRQITSILRISNVQPAMAATYVCTASNIVREDTAGATLVVHSKFKVEHKLDYCYYFLMSFPAIPRILSSEDIPTVTINQFQPVILQCSAAGIPSPQLVWARNRGSQSEILTDSNSFNINDVIDLYQLEDKTVGATFALLQMQLEMTANSLNF